MYVERVAVIPRCSRVERISADRSQFMTSYFGTIDAIGADGEMLESVRASLESRTSLKGPLWGGTFTLQRTARSPEWIRDAYAFRSPVTIRTTTGRMGVVLIHELWRGSSNPWHAEVTGMGAIPFD
jgi:hypothetical protein